MGIRRGMQEEAAVELKKEPRQDGCY